jgi:hypothetical protein
VVPPVQQQANQRPTIFCLQIGSHSVSDHESQGMLGQNAAVNCTQAMLLAKPVAHTLDVESPK